MITVIEQSTEERNQETKELFEEIRPYLDEGYTYKTALIKVGKVNPNRNLNVRGWVRDLIEYGKSQGYLYGDHVFHHANRVGKVKVLAWDHLW